MGHHTTNVYRSGYFGGYVMRFQCRSSGVSIGFTGSRGIPGVFQGDSGTLQGFIELNVRSKVTEVFQRISGMFQDIPAGFRGF